MAWFPCCCPWCCLGFSTGYEYDVTISGLSDDPYGDCTNCASLNGTYTLQYWQPEPSEVQGERTNYRCDFKYDVLDSPYIWECDPGAMHVCRIAMRISPFQQTAPPYDNYCRYEVQVYSYCQGSNHVVGDLWASFRFERAQPGGYGSCSCLLDGTEAFDFYGNSDASYCIEDATIRVEGPA